MSTESHPDLVIMPVGGYPREIGRLLGILAHVRDGTLREIDRVTQEPTDARVDGTSNNVAGLLAQIGLEERLFQTRAFEGREPSDREKELWSGGVDQAGGVGTVPGQALEHHLEQLTAIREVTLRHFFRLSDAWLDELLDLPDGGKANRYWHTYQLAEEEIRLREHIRWLLGRGAP